MNQGSSLAGPKTPRTARGKRTQAKLLEAAEAEFGERGFHEAAINSITQRAGVALGTFYVYFDSKEAIFRALVAHMGRLTRGHLSRHVVGAQTRIEAERQGLRAFIEFAQQHQNLYRIVMEAQFVAEDAYRDYYATFASAYETNLRKAVDNGEIRPGPTEERAWALIGLNVFLGMRYATWDTSKSPEEIADVVGDLVQYGLEPR